MPGDGLEECIHQHPRYCCVVCQKAKQWRRGNDEKYILTDDSQPNVYDLDAMLADYGQFVRRSDQVEPPADEDSGRYFREHPPKILEALARPLPSTAGQGEPSARECAELAAFKARGFTEYDIACYIYAREVEPTKGAKDIRKFAELHAQQLLSQQAAEHPYHEACPKCLRTKELLQQRVAKLERQLREQAVELEAARAESAELAQQFVDANQARRDAESRLRQMEQALRRFGRHRNGCGTTGNSICDSLAGLDWEHSASKWRDCTCGLAEEALPPEEAK